MWFWHEPKVTVTSWRADMDIKYQEWEAVPDDVMAPGSVVTVSPPQITQMVEHSEGGLYKFLVATPSEIGFRYEVQWARHAYRPGMLVLAQGWTYSLKEAICRCRDLMDQHASMVSGQDWSVEQMAEWANGFEPDVLLEAHRTDIQKIHNAVEWTDVGDNMIMAKHKSGEGVFLLYVERCDDPHMGKGYSTIVRTKSILETVAPPVHNTDLQQAIKVAYMQVVRRIEEIRNTNLAAADMLRAARELEF